MHGYMNIKFVKGNYIKNLSNGGDTVDGIEDLIFVYKWPSVLLYDGHFQPDGDVTYFKVCITEN